MKSRDDHETGHARGPGPGGRIIVEARQLKAIAKQYGVDWQPDSVTWYVDGTQVAQCTTADGAISSTPMYLIMNLAVGGSWPGPPNATTPFPAQMTIDWVHVWQ